MRYLKNRLLDQAITVSSSKDSQEIYYALSRREMWRKYTQDEHPDLLNYVEQFLHYDCAWVHPFKKREWLHYAKPIAVFGFEESETSYKGSVYANGSVVAIRNPQADKLELYIEHYSATRLGYPSSKFHMNGRYYGDGWPKVHSSSE